MSESTAAMGIFLAGALAFGAAGAWTLLRNLGNLPAAEKLPRNRAAGLVLGFAALIWCIPHAEVVSPAFLLPLLWPLAVAVPILAYFSLDYLTARAVAGLMILYGYQIVHTAFENRVPGTPVLAVAAWLIGIAGIWVSARPYALRDWIRRVSSSR